MSQRPASRTILSPSSRRMVAGLLISAGILLVIGELLRLYVLLHSWQALGILNEQALVGVLLGLGAGVLTGYAGWRVGFKN